MHTPTIFLPDGRRLDGVPGPDLLG